MNVRRTFPQEFRITMADWADLVNAPRVPGDLFYFTDTRDLVICESEHFPLRTYKSGDMNRRFNVNLNGDDMEGLDRIYFAPPPRFDCDYYLRLVMRWPDIEFNISVRGTDPGLETFFNHRYFPKHTWTKVDLLFKGGRLVHVTAWVGKFKGDRFVSRDVHPLEWSNDLNFADRLESIITNASPVDDALSNLLQKFEKWRLFTSHRMIVYRRPVNQHVPILDTQWRRFRGSGDFFMEIDGKVDHVHNLHWILFRAASREPSLDEKRWFSKFLDSFRTNYTVFFLEDASFEPGLVPSWISHGENATEEEGPGHISLNTRERYARLKAWFEELTELTLVFLPLQLPAYVMLWLFEWVHYDFTFLDEKQRVEMIQGIIFSRRTIEEKREQRAQGLQRALFASLKK
jgi:hypothetical protein